MEDGEDMTRTTMEVDTGAMAVMELATIMAMETGDMIKDNRTAVHMVNHRRAAVEEVIIHTTDEEIYRSHFLCKVF